jgi:hypothetical protein
VKGWKGWDARTERVEDSGVEVRTRISMDMIGEDRIG